MLAALRCICIYCCMGSLIANLRLPASVHAEGNSEAKDFGFNFNTDLLIQMPNQLDIGLGQVRQEMLEKSCVSTLQSEPALLRRIVARNALPSIMIDCIQENPSAVSGRVGVAKPELKIQT